jgi:vancomycin resistance protein VanJ
MWMGSLTQSLRYLCWTYAITLIGYWLLRWTASDVFWVLAFVHNFTPFLFVPLLILIPVALIARWHPLTGLLVALGLWATVWIAPRFISTQTPTIAPTLKVVTFNVWGNNTQLDDAVTWLREQDADVVLLQEIPLDWQASGVPLEDLYPYRMVQPQSVKLWGDALLSKHPFEDNGDFHLQDDMRNPMLYADIAINGQTIRFYNTHLYMPVREQSRITVPPGMRFVELAARYDEGGRNSQIAFLLAEAGQSSYPAVFGGDFNMSDNSPTYHRLTPYLVDSVRSVGGGFSPTWPVAESLGLPGLLPSLVRIDYIWHTSDLVTVTAETGPRLGSDHRPVVAELALIR